jgi:hypothetical protein
LKFFVRVVVLHDPLLDMGNRLRLIFLAMCLAVFGTSGVLLTRTAYRLETAPGVAGVSLGAYAAPSTSAASTSKPLPTPRTRQPALPVSAKQVADRYGLAAFSAIPGTASDAWISEVALLCTSAWLHHLKSAINGSSVVKVARSPHIVETFPSSAPRGEVGVTVLLTTGPASAEETTYVDLVKVGGRYLVAAAQ